jgi:hypothetical protein
MVQYLAIAPALALFAGALSVAPLPRLPWRPSRLAAAGAAILAALLSVALLYVTWTVQPEPVTLQLVLSPWSQPVFRATPAVYVDVVAAVCVLLVTGAALLGALRGLETSDPRAMSGPLLVGAAGALFVAAAYAPLGLVVGWLALDLATFFGARGGRRALIVGQLGLLLAIAGLVGAPAAGEALGISQLEGSARLWVMAAAAIRLGLYPIWWAVPRSERTHLWRACGIRLAPTIAGLYMFLRLAEQTAPGEGLNVRSLLPSLLALFAGGLLGWLAANRAESLDWQTTYSASLVVMAASLGGAVGRGIALVMLIGLVVSRGGQYVLDGVEDQPAVRAARMVLAATAVALPPTIGFAGMWLLYRELAAFHLYWVLAIAVLAASFATAALFKSSRRRRPATRKGRPTVVMVVLLAGVSLLTGLWFGSLDPLVTRVASRGLPSALEDLWLTVSNPLTLANGLLLLGAIVLPALIALGLMRLRPRISKQRRRALRRILRLTLLAEILARAFVSAGAELQQSSGLLESRRAMAWTLLAVTVTGSLVIVAGGSTPATRAMPSFPAMLMFSLAALLAALMVLRGSAVATLGLLLAAYVLVTVVLLAAGVQPVIALTKVLVGALVVAILAVGVGQTPAGDSDGSLLSRLQAAAYEPRGAGLSTLGVALALAAGLLLSLGVHASELTEQLPDALLHPALALIVGGVLTAVFARSPMRLAGGVLFALAGAELLYASLDPGLMITGGLAAFQLLVAVVSSFFIGAVTVDQLSRDRMGT